MENMKKCHKVWERNKFSEEQSLTSPIRNAKEKTLYIRVLGLEVVLKRYSNAYHMIRMFQRGMCSYWATCSLRIQRKTLKKLLGGFSTI